jgi:hypothetical protein
VTIGNGIKSDRDRLPDSKVADRAGRRRYPGVGGVAARIGLCARRIREIEATVLGLIHKTAATTAKALCGANPQSGIHLGTGISDRVGGYIGGGATTLKAGRIATRPSRLEVVPEHDRRIRGNSAEGACREQREESFYGVLFHEYVFLLGFYIFQRV